MCGSRSLGSCVAEALVPLACPFQRLAPRECVAVRLGTLSCAVRASGGGVWTHTQPRSVPWDLSAQSGGASNLPSPWNVRVLEVKIFIYFLYRAVTNDTRTPQGNTETHVQSARDSPPPLKLRQQSGGALLVLSGGRRAGRALSGALRTRHRAPRAPPRRGGDPAQRSEGRGAWDNAARSTAACTTRGDGKRGGAFRPSRTWP